ncbi:MAG: DUF664 domain-containing protein [Candidatus Eisenbacteria bacterium]|uniref:DUF664 domain-containing protein n=1 Tax=Eiseniibacteriota bacterium TaxID=2212470 RepID=A0A849SUP5_UNCEI|nr:DUF664 domain-containing protein [Candidatus Eisenbacteria bacterium]
MNIVRSALVVPAGHRSAAVARFVAQLDDLSERLRADTRGLTPEALSWQLAPGMNTIGMLLTHLAVAEVHLTAVGLEGLPTSDLQAVLGLGLEEEGMPLAAGATPPAALDGRSIEFFDDLMARARANTLRVTSRFEDSELSREVVRPRSDGGRREFTVEWVLHHMVEHFAGHYGQILLLIHARTKLGSRG